MNILLWVDACLWMIMKSWNAKPCNCWLQRMSITSVLKSTLPRSDWMKGSRTMSGFTFHSSDIHGQTLKVARQQMLVEGDNSTPYDYFSICHELQLKFSWTKTKSVVQWLPSKSCQTQRRGSNPGWDNASLAVHHPFVTTQVTVLLLPGIF